MVVHEDMHYGVGVQIRSTNNFKLSKDVKIKNKRVYEIKAVHYSVLLTIQDVITGDKYKVEPHELYNNFIGNYASTIDGIQGSKTEIPFSIWEMNHIMFNLNRLNSAVGRYVRKDYIHLCNPSSKKTYKWQT